jgi:protein-disulfide isomerase
VDLAVAVDAVDHAVGPEHAPVTVVEYGDFECPNCKQAAPAVKLLLGRFAGRVRLVYRHFPLEEVHPHALHAAMAAEAAGSQDYSSSRLSDGSGASPKLGVSTLRPD